jgi:hypothetical protein
MYASIPAVAREKQGRAEESGGTSKSQLGMIADEQRPVAVHRGREFPSDDRARRRSQSLRQMFFIFDKNQIRARG